MLKARDRPKAKLIFSEIEVFAERILQIEGRNDGYSDANKADNAGAADGSEQG